MSRSELLDTARRAVRAGLSGNLGRCGKSVSAGQWLHLRRRFTCEDVERFAAVTWDANPIHLNSEERPIVHGLLCANLIPTMFAARIPGAVYVSQDLRFKQPVFVDDEVQAEISVEQLKDLRGRIVLDCRTVVLRLCSDLEKQIAVEGKARVLIPAKVL